MKIRNGFVSNSSSSSFIIQKNALTETQCNTIRELFIKHPGFESELMENDVALYGYVESHNGSCNCDYVVDECNCCNEPLSVIMREILDSFNIDDTKKYFDIEYCCCLSDLSTDEINGKDLSE